MAYPYRRLIKPRLGTPIIRGHKLGGLVLCGLMNENGGITVLDLSENGKTGTLAGGTTPVWVPGKFGPTLYFNGGYVDFGDGTGITLNRSAFSISYWANTPLTTPTILRQLVSQEGAGAEDVFRFFWHSADDKLYFDVWNVDHTNTQAAYTSNPFAVANSWHHIVGVYNGVNTYVYVDGVVGSTIGTLTGATRSTSDRNLRVGADSDGADAWNGSIDIPMFFPYALPPSEIALLHREPFCMFKDFNEWAVLGGFTAPVVGAAGIMTTNSGYWGPTF